MFVIKKNVLALSVAIVFISGLSGCVDQMSKEDIGTGVGALAGALLGNKMGGGAMGTIIGAAAGGFLGKTIGAHLDEEDRKELAAQTAKNLENLNAGQSMEWKSSRTTNSAKVSVSQVTEEKRQINIPAASAITVPADIKLLNKTYQVSPPK
jgi:surface antigen